MNQILKRLEIIKNFIEIEEVDLIKIQITKIRTLTVDTNIYNILDKLEETKYKQAYILIEAYLAKVNEASVDSDKELSNLKLELKIFEINLQELLEKRIEYLCEIDRYNSEYNLKLGALIQAILNFKKEILHKKTINQETLIQKYHQDCSILDDTKNTITELKETIPQLEKHLENLNEDDENYNEIFTTYKELKEALEKLKKDFALQEEELPKIKSLIEDIKLDEMYEEVKSQYDDYILEYQQFREIERKIINLDKNEKEELKKLFKNAIILCHPNIVTDEFKEKAHKLMQELNDAYTKQDLKAVQKILNSLESGSGLEFSSDSTNDKELLKEKIEEYKQYIADIESEIEAIKEDGTYQTISQLDDWDAYFETIKNELKEEIERLKEETIEVIGEQTREEDLPAKKIEYLSIELTSIDYLIEDIAVDMRESLLDNNLLNPILSIEHEKNNSYDNLAIKIYCNQIFIGYVLKYKDRENIDSFSFENDQLKNIKAEFIEGCLCLSREI